MRVAGDLAGLSVAGHSIGCCISFRQAGRQAGGAFDFRQWVRVQSVNSSGAVNAMAESVHTFLLGLFAS